MKDKIKSGGDVLRGLIKTSGDVADKALDKSSDLAQVMMHSMSGLISKLSDDIGIMANRILTMEERIGLMADRILKTEELMASLTAAMANKELDLPSNARLPPPAGQIPVLFIRAEEATADRSPAVRITGNPAAYLLCVSPSPLFAESATVVTRVQGVRQLDAAWRRSVGAIEAAIKEKRDRSDSRLVVSVAVRAIDHEGQASGLSNSVEIRVPPTHRSREPGAPPKHSSTRQSPENLR
jgi:hypothetical protein